MSVQLLGDVSDRKGFNQFPEKRASHFLSPLYDTMVVLTSRRLQHLGSTAGQVLWEISEPRG